MTSDLEARTAGSPLPFRRRGPALARPLLVAAVVSVAAGCAHAPQFDFASAGRRVALLPVDAEIVEIQLGPTRERREDWSATARDRFREALREALEARGYSVSEGDPTSLGIEVDFLVRAEVRDAHNSPEVVAREIALGIVLLPLALLGVDFYEVAEEAARIWFERAGTSEIVWTVAKQGGLWDVRNELGARRNVQKLMKDFPIEPQRGEQAVAETPSAEGVDSASASSR